MLILPLGLDSARLSRLPVVSAALAVACVLTFAATQISRGGDEAEEAAGRAIQYFREHPYLVVPELLAERFGMHAAQVHRLAPPDGLTDGAMAEQQAQLDALAEDFVVALDGSLEYRLSLVPARGALQPGWITSLFVHGSLGHLFGNLLIFLLVTGPFLEEVWGRPFYLAFYLLGGVVAAVFQLPFMPAHIPLLGASGAISACLGAFALRFAHRKVRMFWVVIPMIFIRGQFSVPAWLYALFGFGMDLLGLKLSGDGGTAYGAHVGGFLFGVLVALGVRWSGLERRIAPEGAVAWQPSMAMNRAADALAEGDVLGARLRLEEELAKKPGNLQASLELARLHARLFDASAAADALEPVLARRLADGDLAGAKALVTELQGRLRADRFRPATAYRLAEVIEGEDPAFSLALLAAAGAAGGGLGAKALARVAQRVAAAEPERARDLLARAEPMAADAEVRARIAAQRAALPPPPARGLDLAEDPAGAREFPAAVPVREVRCRVAKIDGGTLDVVMPDGRAARLTPDRVTRVSAALLARLPAAGGERTNAVVLDLVLRPQAARPGLVLVRIAGHDLGLAQHRPEVPPAVAFAELVESILLEGGGDAWPDPARVQGRPFARFPDLAGYEQACFGRRVSTDPAPQA